MMYLASVDVRVGDSVNSDIVTEKQRDSWRVGARSESSVEKTSTKICEKIDRRNGSVALGRYSVKVCFRQSM